MNKERCQATLILLGFEKHGKYIMMQAPYMCTFLINSKQIRIYNAWSTKKEKYLTYGQTIKWATKIEDDDYA